MSSQLLHRAISRKLPFRHPRTPSLCRFATSTAASGTASAQVHQVSRGFLTLGLAAGVTGAYVIGSIYPPSTLSLLFPRPAPAPPSASSTEATKIINDLESQLQALPFLHALRTSPDADEWYETRPYVNYPEERRVNSLTAGALSSPGRIAIPPLVRARNDEKESVVIAHLGRGLCGHDGIIHGVDIHAAGAVMKAIVNLPALVGVTATLSLKYRAPTRADQFVVIRTYLGETTERKARVTGRVEDLQGNLLVEADALFVQPKYAKLLNSGAVRQALGERKTVSDETGTRHPAPVLLADGEKLVSKAVAAPRSV